MPLGEIPLSVGLGGIELVNPSPTEMQYVLLISWDLTRTEDPQMALGLHKVHQITDADTEPRPS